MLTITHWRYYIFSKYSQFNSSANKKVERLVPTLKLKRIT